MLEPVCYTLAVILLGLAAVLPGLVQRDRLAYAGLCAAVVPIMVHALQHH